MKLFSIFLSRSFSHLASCLRVLSMLSWRAGFAPFVRLLCPFSPLSEHSGCFHILYYCEQCCSLYFFVIFLGYVLICKFFIYSCIYLLTGLPRWLSDKESNVGDSGDKSSILGWEDPLEEEMATHASILAWKIPWTEKPGRPQSVHRVTKSWKRLSNGACMHLLVLLFMSNFMLTAKLRGMCRDFAPNLPPYMHSLPHYQ